VRKLIATIGILLWAAISAAAQEKTFWNVGQTCQMAAGQVYVTSPGGNYYSELVGSLSGMHSRMCVKRAGFFDFRNCIEVTLYNFQIMCRGGLATLPQFYMAAFGNSPDTQAGGVALSASGDQLSYVDPGDGLGTPRQRVSLPVGYAPLPAFETQVRRLQWDNSRGRPALSQSLRSDQENRIKQLFEMRGNRVEPFPENNINRAIAIADERPPAPPPPPPPPPPPVAVQPPPITTTPPVPPKASSPPASTPKQPSRQVPLIFAFIVAGLVWLAGLKVLKKLPADSYAAKIAIGILVAVVSSLILFAFGIKDELTVLSFSLFGGLIVLALNVFF
jgi:hypothetical protein